MHNECTLFTSRANNLPVDTSINTHRIHKHTFYDLVDEDVTSNLTYTHKLILIEEWKKIWQNLNKHLFVPPTAQMALPAVQVK